MNYSLKKIGTIISVLFFILQGCVNSMGSYTKKWKTSEYNNKQVCDYIIIDNAWKDEAKKRGLNCVDNNKVDNTQLNGSDRIQKLKDYGYFFNETQLVHRFSGWSNREICIKAFNVDAWSVVDENYPMVQEAKRRNLDCKNNDYKNETVYAEVNTKPAETFSVLNSKSNTNDKSINVASNLNKTCSILQNKLLAHIDNGQYDQASSARKLMKEMECSTNSNTSSSSNSSSTNTQTYVPPKKASKYSLSQLSCSVGPLGKYMFRDYGKYYSKAFDNNPPKACNATFQYCKSRARAIAKGANIAPSEKSPSSYSADCSLYGTNKYNTSADCTITPNSSGGGFAGGFANELGKGIARQTAMKRIYVSNFEICMSEMGYSLTEQ